MSSSSLEHIAEDFIAHVLQRNHILVAKPKFDHNGADLIALLDVDDGAKFCRIQCKGRSLINSKKSYINIPKHYVTDAFVVILFVEDGCIADQNLNLFCFFGIDIRKKWKIDNKENYTLRFSRKNYKQTLAEYVFDNQTVHKIMKTIINVVNLHGEFKTMGHGYAECEFPAFVGEARGS
jgi:hypothetical protein